MHVEARQLRLRHGAVRLRLRPPHVLDPDPTGTLLVREHAGLLEYLYREPRVTPFRGDLGYDVERAILDAAIVEGQLRPLGHDVPELLGRVLAELYQVRPFEGARGRRVQHVEDVLLRDQYEGHERLRLKFLLAEPRELVYDVGAGLLEQHVRLVQDDHHVELAFLQVLPEYPEHLGDGESPVGEVGLEVVHDLQHDRRLAVPLPAVDDGPVDRLLLLLGVVLEVCAEPLGRGGLARAHTAGEDRVLGAVLLHDRPEEHDQALHLVLSVYQLGRHVVERQCALILEDALSDGVPHLAHPEKSARNQLRPILKKGGHGPPSGQTILWGQPRRRSGENTASEEDIVSAVLKSTKSMLQSETLIVEAVQDLVRDEVKKHIRQKLESDPELREELKH